MKMKKQNESWSSSYHYHVSGEFPSSQFSWFIFQDSRNPIGGNGMWADLVPIHIITNHLVQLSHQWLPMEMFLNKSLHGKWWKISKFDQKKLTSETDFYCDKPSNFGLLDSVSVRSSTVKHPVFANCFRGANSVE